MIDEETARIIGEAIAPRWHWRPGCLVQGRIVLERVDARVQRVEYLPNRARLSCFHDDADTAKRGGVILDTKASDCWPDFRDAATLGQLEETVNDIWGDQGPMCAVHLPFLADWPRVWTVASTAYRRKPYMVGGWWPSKAEALASAWLEATSSWPQPEEGES